MTYELGFFDELVNELLNPSSKRNFTSKAEYGPVLELIQMHKIGIMKRMQNKVLELGSPASSEFYIAKHREALLRNVNSLGTLMTREDMLAIYSITNKPLMTNLYKILYRSLEEMQYFMESTLPGIFVRDLPLSAVARIMTAKELEDIAASLKPSLAGAGVDPRLLEIAFDHIGRFIVQPVADITFGQVNYFKELLNVITALLQSGELTARDPDVAMITKLFYMNFNSYAFYDYCCSYIQRDLRHRKTRAEQEQRLVWYIGVVDDYQLRPHFALYLSDVKPTIKELLGGWLAGYQARLDYQPQFADALDDFPKMKTETSVPVLALLFKTFHRVGFWQPETDIFLSRFVCRNFMSLRSEVIGEESFRKKMYTRDLDTHAAVKDLLQDLLHTITLQEKEIKSSHYKM